MGGTATFSEDHFFTYLFEQATGLGLQYPYLFWHSPGESAPLLVSGYRSGDDALDRVRRSTDREEFRAAVRAYERALADDPPAAFLAWNESSRAVSRRFDVSQ